MSSPKPRIVLAFDLYGTLLSTASIAKELAEHFGEDKAAAFATTWRTLQLEYTWRLNSMNQYIDFSTITSHSLGHALRSHSLSLSPSAISSLMKAYNSLSTFADVAPALQSLASKPHIHPVVFSNGTEDMVSASVHNSPDLAPHAAVFKDLITIENVQCFKPAPKVYEHLAMMTDMEDQVGQIWLVSGNPFDVVGARAAGMRAAWVDREGNGWEDGLIDGNMGKPTIVVRGLEEVVGKVEKWMDEKGIER